MCLPVDPAEIGSISPNAKHTRGRNALADGGLRDRETLVVEAKLHQPGAECGAFHILHHHVVELTFRVEVEIVDLDDVGVHEPGGGQRLTAEA